MEINIVNLIFEPIESTNYYEIIYEYKINAGIVIYDKIIKIESSNSFLLKKELIYYFIFNNHINNNYFDGLTEFEFNKIQKSFIEYDLIYEEYKQCVENRILKDLTIEENYAIQIKLKEIYFYDMFLNSKYKIDFEIL